MTVLHGPLPTLHQHPIPSPPASPTVDFVVAGGLPSDPSAAWHNQATLNATLHALQPGDTLHIPRGIFHVMGGVEGVSLRDVTIRIDGTLKFSPDTSAWPNYGDRVAPKAGLAFWDAAGLTLTSSSQGVLDGNGRAWWSVPGIGYLIHVEHRPRLLTIDNSTGILVENLLLIDSPYWTTRIHNVDGLTIRHCGISARRTNGLRHSIIDLTAFNTDGFDVHGRNVHVHDCQIWTQDDAIAVKDYIDDDHRANDRRAGYSDAETRGNHTPIAIPSENMLFERINASGLGLTIGSIGEGIVRNITFRDCYLRRTVKGLYLKFRRGHNHTGGVGVIDGVTYERIVLDEPVQWPIWIGPAQQADARNPCRPNPCSLCWPMLPPTLTGARCTGATTGEYSRITLRDVDIYAPRHAPGVLLADPSLPMAGVVFDGVRTHAQCGAASRYAADAFTTAFSLLPPTVAPDANITVIYVLLGLGAVVAAIACAGVATRGGARVRAFAAALLVALAAIGARLSAVSVDLRSASSYYRCEGIEGGVALGDTWPVPKCFEDRTVRRGPPPQPPCGSDGLLGSETAWWAVLSAAALLLAAVCCCRGADPQRGPPRVKSTGRLGQY